MDIKALDAIDVLDQLGTRDVFEIARSNGVKIMYGSWHPITIGEFERDTKTIRVNKRAVAEGRDGETLEIKIIAHELGHFFAASMKLDRVEEESFSHAFATALVGIEAD